MFDYFDKFEQLERNMIDQIVYQKQQAAQQAWGQRRFGDYHALCAEIDRLEVDREHPFDLEIVW